MLLIKVIFSILFSLDCVIFEPLMYIWCWLRYSEYNAGKKVSAQNKYVWKFSRKYRLSDSGGVLVFDGMTRFVVCKL
jgi:hypothetical protein